MSKDANSTSRLSFAGRDPELSRTTPASLRNQAPVKHPFDHARDPLISAQLKAMEQTEAQRREESGRGSTMVKLDKPFPDLRPKNDNSQIRPAFNQAWIREQRAARIAQLQEERAAQSTPEQQQNTATLAKALTQEYSR